MLWKPRFFDLFRSTRNRIIAILLPAIASYVLIPQVVGAREVARLTPCRNQLRTVAAGYVAHTVIIDDDNQIVSVESDPLWTMPVDRAGDDSLTAYFRKLASPEDRQRLAPQSVDTTLRAEARRQIAQLRTTREFRYRQGLLPLAKVGD